MAKASQENKTNPAAILVAVVALLAAFGAFAWEFVSDDAGRERTPCNGVHYLASPGWFHDDWCVQQRIPYRYVDPDGAEVESISWVGDCFPTKEQAVAACSPKP